MYGWLAAKNLNIACLGETEELGEGVQQYNHLLNKFPKDQVFCDRNSRICFLDGYVHNKDDFLSDSSQSWTDAFADAASKDLLQSLRMLRGGFCGYVYNKDTEAVAAYVDQVSVKALYYWAQGEKWMLSNCLDYMIEVLKNNDISYNFHPLAAQYMLTYGYMLDDSTFVEQIHRILPGKYVQIDKGHVEVTRYHFINNKEISISEQEAVEKIDIAFRQAVRREFEKDREYGYRHLVDLSGGLDSRMVSWVAHDMGYTDQLNITYSQADYQDDIISKRIAGYLKHEYLFKPLDDAQWLYDIEKMVSYNNGSALYSGITGGSRLLGILNTKEFGIEHTGMLGDVTLSTYYHDYKLNFGKPQFGLNMYSEKLTHDFDSTILQEYPCQEMFVIYTRGILGMQSTYMTRQQYIETASPFMDVDFLDTVFSIPFEYRNKHHIYLKWINDKYPEAAKFGWEKWGGIKPKESHIFFRKIKTTQRLLWQAACKVFKTENRDSMNPIDYWYQRDKKIQQYYQTFYENHINNGALSDALKGDISVMFQDGNVTEKSMALTVLAVVGKYFG